MTTLREHSAGLILEWRRMTVAEAVERFIPPEMIADHEARQARQRAQQWLAEAAEVARRIEGRA